LNIEIEARRADGSYRILGSIMGQALKIGVFDSNSEIDIKLYKTDDNNYDLYLFIGTYIEQVFVKMTEPLYFTYDGSVVTSYVGTKINPIYSNSIDSVTSGNLQPVTSNAVASLLDYEEYEVNLSYSAGAIGSKGNQAQLDITKNGYTPISFEIVYITDNAKVIPLCFCANNINQLLVNSYRTTTNAETVSGRVRVTYRKIS
jgi:hypothetical protein